MEYIINIIIIIILQPLRLRYEVYLEHVTIYIKTLEHYALNFSVQHYGRSMTAPEV